MAGFLQRPIVLFVVLALICPILPLSVPSTDSLLLRNLEGKSFLVVGGTGRVGGSVARVLQQNGARRVSVGGRTNVVGGFSVGGNDRFDFVNIDKDDRNSLSTVSWSDFDLVVNTAGPFQGKTSQTNLLLSKCIEASVPYIDVCDDFETATRAKVRRWIVGAKRQHISFRKLQLVASLLTRTFHIYVTNNSSRSCSLLSTPLIAVGLPLSCRGRGGTGDPFDRVLAWRFVSHG